MKTTQANAILAALKAGRRLTPIDALREFGCFRLAARIHELRQAGHDIRDDRVTDCGATFCVYFIPKEAIK